MGFLCQCPWYSKWVFCVNVLGIQSGVFCVNDQTSLPAFFKMNGKNGEGGGKGGETWNTGPCVENHGNVALLWEAGSGKGGFCAGRIIICSANIPT